MSIKIMAQVWSDGPDDRGELLVLLALSDFANDKGECWPSIATVANKARMEPRSVQRICRKLVADGWLKIDACKARYGCNMYVVTPDARVTPDTVSPLTPVSPPPDARVTPPLTPVSPKPSLNHQEPSFPPTPQGGRRKGENEFRYSKRRLSKGAAYKEMMDKIVADGIEKEKRNANHK